MKNIFYGLCFCVEKAEEIEFRGIKSKFISETKKHLIKKESFGKDLAPDLPDDLSIEIEEYAPKVFQKVKDLESLTKLQLIK
jgi:hypothetical protein